MSLLVSVVLCTYNGAAFLQEQLASILQQTYPHLEVIISDDASTDGTPELLGRYRHDPRVRLFFQPRNLGPVAHFSFAAGQATGDFIAFSDQDDIWLPHKIERLLAAIGDADLVYSDSELVDEQGASLGKRLSGLRRMYTGRDTRGFVFSNTVWGHALLLRRRLLPQLLPVPEGVPHDIWAAVVAARNAGIRYLDEPLTRYRQHSATVTTTLPPDAVRARTGTKRWRDYEEKRHWIGLLRDGAGAEERPFYESLYRHFSAKGGGRFQWGLLLFLWKHREALYRFSRKGGLSRLLLMVKTARGEREA